MTLLQEKAIRYVIQGDSAHKAMLKAGYSPASAVNPRNLTRSRAFIRFLDKVGAKDQKLAQRINEGLDATKSVVMGIKSEESFVDIQPDYYVRHKYIETTLKLKGYLNNNEANQNNLVVQIPILGGATNVPDNDSNQETT